MKWTLSCRRGANKASEVRGKCERGRKADRQFDPASDLRAAAGNILSEAALDKSGVSSAEMECRQAGTLKASFFAALSDWLDIDIASTNGKILEPIP